MTVSAESALLPAVASRLRPALRAAVWHMCLSIAVAALVAFLVFGFWFPGALRELAGGADLFWLIVGVVAAVIFIVPIALIAAVAFASSSGDSLWFLSFLLLLIPLGIAVTVWVSVRLYFATLIAVVEGATPPTALRRSWTLTKGAFWRVLGRMLLMSIIVSIVVGLLGGTISVVIMFATSVLPWAVTAFLLALVSALVSGLAMPFSASYTSLMYVDERIRKENLGPVLAQAFDASHGTQA